MDGIAKQQHRNQAVEPPTWHIITPPFTAIHPGEFKTARELVSIALLLVEESGELPNEHPEVQFTGYIQHVLKENVKANAVLALIRDELLLRLA